MRACSTGPMSLNRDFATKSSSGAVCCPRVPDLRLTPGHALRSFARYRRVDCGRTSGAAVDQAVPRGAAVSVGHAANASAPARVTVRMILRPGTRMLRPVQEVDASFDQS
jgi:hypothetical protein